MKKIALLLMFIVTNLFAGEVEQLYPLGFSANAKYFAYAQLVTLDGSGFTFAKVNIIEVANNNVAYVLNFPKKEEVDSYHMVPPAKILNMALEKSKAELDKYEIVDHNFVSAEKQGNALAEEGMSFALTETSPSQFTQKVNMRTKLAGNQDCDKCILLNLSVSVEGQLTTTWLNEKQTKDNFSNIYQYEMKEVLFSASFPAMGIEKTPVVFVLRAFLLGFEGPSITHRIVSGLVPPFKY